jgi:hypothetical protein
MKKTYSIVGTNFRGKEAEALVKTLKPGEEIALVREPTNKFDKNAVQVWARETCIGYLPKNQNAQIAMAMDADLKSPSASALIEAGEAVTVSRSGRFVLSPNSAFPQVEVDE